MKIRNYCPACNKCLGLDGIVMRKNAPFCMKDNTFLRFREAGA